MRLGKKKKIRKAKVKELQKEEEIIINKMEEEKEAETPKTEAIDELFK